MATPDSVSVRARDFVNRQLTIFAVIWFSAPLLAYLFGSFLGGMLTMGGLWLFARLGTIPPRHIAAEIDLAPRSFREYQFRARTRLFAVILIVQAVAAALANSLFVWVLTATMLVVGGALLAHDRLEIAAMPQIQPNKAPEPTPTSVMPAAEQPSRRP